ncbi:hypothetical protein JWG44_21800 [Leptospira sp. 201903071]|uniref:hypothetical protein n=1 Tax=Leptospira ainazelensis TaxID=2810034 RepID=UPI001964ACA8|nr:hypothetical protein [Leptospira ainazelensis]MBM9502890.1 hypothetical protein [Leptospira ainazelensis]
MALTEEELTYSKKKIEELQKIISDLKNLREEVPAPVSSKLNDGLGHLESGLHRFLDLTYAQ